MATRMPAPSLKGRALRLLSMREHSRLELERRLQAHETEPGALARALDDLQAKGFISEQRVIESVLNRRRASLGSARIRQELQSKGLDGSAIKDALRQLQGSELERARDIWRRKFSPIPSVQETGHKPDAAERARQMRFLLSRGFAADVVRKVVAEPDFAQESAG